MSKDNGKDNRGFENRFWAATLPTGQADALPELFADIRRMIEEARVAVAATVNAWLTMLYWRVGKRINEEVLGHERAEYGKHIVATLSRQLASSYGKGITKKNLRQDNTVTVVNLGVLT
jgi:DUF1016 N-terminal domain